MVQHADIDHTGLTGVGAGTPTVTANEVMNWPARENVDNGQPEWWEESAGTATLTNVDVAGESITETWERCMKVVTTADVYAYQRYTYADQPRLKSGRVVSCRVAVWSVSGVTARVRIQDSNGSLGLATTTAAAWTILTVDAVTLTGTYVDLRFEVNNGTAYFVPLAFGVGDLAPNELLPRGGVYLQRDAGADHDFDFTADSGGYVDADCTSLTSNLAYSAVMVFSIQIPDGNANIQYALYVRRNGSSISNSESNKVGTVRTNTSAGRDSARSHGTFPIVLDDSQIFEYDFDIAESSTSADATSGMSVLGWWEWE